MISKYKVMANYETEKIFLAEVSSVDASLANFRQSWQVSTCSAKPEAFLKHRYMTMGIESSKYKRLEVSFDGDVQNGSSKQMHIPSDQDKQKQDENSLLEESVEKENSIEEEEEEWTVS